MTHPRRAGSTDTTTRADFTDKCRRDSYTASSVGFRAGEAEKIFISTWPEDEGLKPMNGWVLEF